MKNSLLGFIFIAILGVAVLLNFLSDSPAIREESDSLQAIESRQQGVQEQSPTAHRPERNLTTSATSNLNKSALTEQVLAEVSTRLREHQADEALNELAGLLDGYDEMSDIDKSKVLQAYAGYFLNLSQFEDVYFFYDSIIELPDLGFDNRMAFIQLAARMASRQEDWNRFLEYNDQYFAAGGEYNYLVADNLTRAYTNLGDYNAAADALLQYLNTGVNPVTIETEERYQRWVSIHEELPQQVLDPALALELAQSLVDQFDRLENWKTLAEIYAEQDDETNYNQTLRTAQSRGFIDAEGNWIQ